MISNQLKNQHLMWRAGFGPAAGQLQQLEKVSQKDLFKALQKGAAKRPAFLDATDGYLQGLFKGIQEEGQRRQQMNADERKKFQQETRKSIRSLNLLWLDEMVHSEAQLREKMSFFWHGHFASRNLNVFFQQQLLDIIRVNALGSFRTLLHQVSKSAAILNFLNASQNRKDHPNENFAREVMELFTLGRGHYSEQDVKEAARAFTGWGANIKGDFVFRRFQHDNGIKTVLYQQGNLDGDEVLDILLEQKQTARFITKKIYRFFVNEKADEEKIAWLSERFFQSDYYIGQLVEDIFTSDWFYDAENIGTRIKSPVELLAGIRRTLPMEIENEEAQLLLQRLLGQLLFFPPNVAGWPGGKSWIDSSTLMLRMRLPQLLTDADEINLQPKTDDDQGMGKIEMNNMAGMGRVGKPVQASIHWNEYLENFNAAGKRELLPYISGKLLQVTPSFSEALISKYLDSGRREDFIKSATVALMSTPEYQMC